jgi:hypothetical protein
VGFAGVFHAANHAISDAAYAISDTFVPHRKEEPIDKNKKEADKKETDKAQADKIQTDKTQTDKRNIQSTPKTQENSKPQTEKEPKPPTEKKEERDRTTHTVTKTAPHADKKINTDKKQENFEKATGKLPKTEKTANTDKLPTDRNLPFNNSPKARNTHKDMPQKAANTPQMVLNPESPDHTDQKQYTPTKRYSDNNAGTAYGDATKQKNPTKKPNSDNNAGTAYGAETSTPTNNRYSDDNAGTAYGAETPTQKSPVPKSANSLATGSPDPKDKG